jgi:hypothetical protein
MKRRIFFTSACALRDAVFLFALLISAGCGENSLKLTASENKAFGSAASEIRQTWEKALAADKAKDYSNAQTLLESLHQMQLSEDQRNTLEKERADFGQRLWAAAEKNDPEAVKAVQASQKSRNQNRGLPAR